MTQKRYIPTPISVRYDPLMMLSYLTTRFLDSGSAVLSKALSEEAIPNLGDAIPEIEESAFLMTMGWISAGLGALALGLFVGRELRQRYKFNRRTPYDFYSHSGDEHDLEFGVGI